MNAGRSGDASASAESTRVVLGEATARDDARGRPGAPIETPVPERIGRYAVVGTLGRGGMGVVYEARDAVLGRAVALKLVRGGRSIAEADARARLIREAQSIAALSHPNIVEVYEIGRHGDEVFIAMELVVGTNLRRWLDAGPRRTAEVLAVLQQAGLGLAAAHRAGIIHRDFKPDNVMVSAHGRVRVLDFGLARAGASIGSVGRSGAGSDDHLTQTGAAMGTPAYMAPEQYVGGELDGRTDQFAFCTVLVEALSGVRPFLGATLEALALHKTSGQINPAAWRGVPHRVARVLRRGLASRREDRWPDMDALLAALPGPASARTAIVAVGALAAVTAAIGVLSSSAGPCPGDEERRAEIWDDARREQVRAAILATGVAHADATWERVRRQLDDRTLSWALAVGTACRASRSQAHGVDSCLEQRRIGLVAAIDALRGTDATTVHNAERVGAMLDDAESCGRSGSTAPTSGKLDEARTRLAAASALVALGRPRDAAVELDAAPAVDESVDREGLVARMQLLRAAIARGTGDDLGAVAPFERAYFAALAAERDDLAVRAAAELASEGAVGYRDRWQWAAHARAALGRIDTSTGAAIYDRAMCTLQRDSGALALAADHCARALAAAEREANIDERIAALRAFADVRTAADELVSARDLYADALAAAAGAWGSEHPAVADALDDLGHAELRLGHLELARQLGERAVAVRVAALPGGDDTDPRLARSWRLLASVDFEQGAWARARAGFERALALQRRQLGESHHDVAESWHALALAQEKLGDRPAALASMAQAAAIEERLHPLDIARLPTLRELARMAFEFGAGPTAGREHLERAWAIVHSSGVPLDHPLVKDLDHGYGETLLALGHADEALEYLERFVADPRPHAVRPHVAFVLARALWKSGRDHERALALVRASMQTWATPSDSLQREQVASMTRWLQATDDGRTNWDEGYRWRDDDGG